MSGGSWKQEFMLHLLLWTTYCRYGGIAGHSLITLTYC